MRYEWPVPGGASPDDAGRICPMAYRMPVPAGHRGSGYPILIWKRGKTAGCGMRAGAATVSWDTARVGILHFPPKSVSWDFGSFAASRII